MMMRRIRKPHRAKPKKKWWKHEVLWHGVLATVILGTAFYTIFFHPTLQLKEIKVEGIEKIRAADIQAHITSRVARKIVFMETESMFLIPVKKIQESLLRDFPQLATANIKRVWPDTLAIIVQERKKVALWCFRDEQCSFIDPEGIIFEEAGKEEKEEFFFVQDIARREAPRLGEQVISQELLGQMFALKTELQNIQVEAEKAVLVSQERMNIKTTEGWEIYFALPPDISWQITRLQLVLEKEIPAERRQGLKYIDLRFSKVYYKYASNEL